MCYTGNLCYQFNFPKFYICSLRNEFLGRWGKNSGERTGVWRGEVQKKTELARMDLFSCNYKGPEYSEGTPIYCKRDQTGEVVSEGLTLASLNAKDQWDGICKVPWRPRSLTNYTNDDSLGCIVEFKLVWTTDSDSGPKFN